MPAAFRQIDAAGLRGKERAATWVARLRREKNPLERVSGGQAGASAACSALGKGLKVEAIRKAPIPMAQEPT
jgi:hypothetical protein